MGVFERRSADKAVTAVGVAPKLGHANRRIARRVSSMVCLLVVASFALGQVVTHASPAIAARANPEQASAAPATMTPQQAAQVRLSAAAAHAAVLRIAGSIRDVALGVARADTTAHARAVAKARAHAKARARARAHAKARARAHARELARKQALARLRELAKSHQAATPKRDVTQQVSTQATSQIAPLLLSLSANVAPNPDFMASCATPSDSSFCLGQEVEAIDNARALEGLSPMALNLDAFTQLSTAEQLFVLTNLERTSRGLSPAEVLTAQLDTTSLKAARATVDPTLNGWTLTGGKQAVAWNSNWSGGMSATESDYYWMYDDGAGYNVDCTATVTSGCWEHRANILAGPAESCPGAMAPQFVMGAASTDTASYSPSETSILVQVCGGLPTDAVFSWSQAEKLLGISFG
jgi:hypothetical protein